MEERLAERRADGGVRELLDRERQLAELEDRDQVLRVGQRVAADRAALADLHLAVGDRLVDHRCGDDLAVEHDREVVAGVVGRVAGEQVLARGLQGEVDRALARLVRADRGRRDLVAREQHTVHGGRGVALRVERLLRQLLAGDGRGLAERDEVEPARRAHEVADLVGVLDARHLDDDPVVALDHDLGLGDTRLVDAVDDDLAQDVQVIARRRLALGRQHLVLDPQAALQIETQLGLEVVRSYPRPGRRPTAWGTWQSPPGARARR